jgi:AcrR family transcriptional regulator
MNSKTRIMHAAERVILREGPAKLTLDAVAAEAGISKGGLLYHFPSKDDLIRGMVEHLISDASGSIQRSIAEDPDERGRATRAILRTDFPDDERKAERQKQVSVALMAAIFTNPSLAEPVREVIRQCQVSLEDDGIDPTRATLIQLAADGLWMTEMLGLPGPAPERRRQVIELLFKMTRE